MESGEIYKGNYIDAALVRRKAWEVVGGFHHIQGGWEDFDFWCRFVECGLSAQQIPKLGVIVIMKIR